jgi:hypothetical protein
MSTVKRAPKGTRKPKTKPGQSDAITPTLTDASFVDVYIGNWEGNPLKDDPPYVRYAEARKLDVGTIRKMEAQLRSSRIVNPNPFVPTTVPASVKPPAIKPVVRTHSHASYLKPIVPRVNCDRTIEQVIEKLKGVDFDTIAVRGVSGLLVGPCWLM